MTFPPRSVFRTTRNDSLSRGAPASFSQSPSASAAAMLLAASHGHGDQVVSFVAGVAEHGSLVWTVTHWSPTAPASLYAWGRSVGQTLLYVESGGHGKA